MVSCLIVSLLAWKPGVPLDSLTMGLGGPWVRGIRLWRDCRQILHVHVNHAHGMHPQ